MIVLKSKELSETGTIHAQHESDSSARPPVQLGQAAANHGFKPDS
jgi:hypothetical protein